MFPLLKLKGSTLIKYNKNDQLSKVNQQVQSLTVISHILN